MKTVELNISIATVFFNIQTLKMIANFLNCSKSYQQKFNKTLKEIFFNTYKFSNHDKNKFILLLRKGVYPYEYMDDWEKFNQMLLPKKEFFYSHLNMEDITDADYAHAKRVWNKKIRIISWFVCSKQYIIFG